MVRVLVAHRFPLLLIKVEAFTQQSCKEQDPTLPLDEAKILGKKNHSNRTPQIKLFLFLRYS